MVVSGVVGCEPEATTDQQASASAASAQVELRFGLYPSDKPSAMVKQFRPGLDVLERIVGAKLGQSVTFQLEVAASYDTGLDNIVKGNVDISRLGAASYISAKRLEPGIELVALESKKGRKSFNGIICVHKKSSVKTVADLKGKTFAFGNKRSTLGRFVAQQLLVKSGIKASDLAGFEYLGRHDTVGTAVGLGKFDAGALKESTFDKLVKKGTPIKKLATLETVTKPWVARKGLDPKIVSAVREALLSLKDAAALKALGKDGFVEGSDDDYADMRKAIDESASFGASVTPDGGS